MNNEEKNARARVGAWLGAALSAVGALVCVASPSDGCRGVRESRRDYLVVRPVRLHPGGALKTLGTVVLRAVVSLRERDISSVIFAASIPNPGYRFKNS